MTLPAYKESVIITGVKCSITELHTEEKLCGHRQESQDSSLVDGGFFFFFFLRFICKYTVAVFRHTRRGLQLSLQMVVSHHVVAGI